MRQLSKNEIDRLRDWQKKMLITFTLAMLVILAAVSLKLSIGLSPEAEYVFAAVFIVLAVIGGLLQFSAKCPNCGARIGLQSRLLLPSRCSKCKIPFR
jgi:hypothetical protein